MQRSSNNSARVLAFPKHPVLGVNMTIQEEMGFFRKPDIIQEFFVIDFFFFSFFFFFFLFIYLLFIYFFYLFFFFAKTTGYPLFHIGLGQLVLALDLIEIIRMCRTEYTKILSSWLLCRKDLNRLENPDDVLVCSDCCLFSLIFTSAISFKALGQLEKLTPNWRCVEIELPCLNNLERLSFIMCFYTKDFLLHRPRHYFTMFG